MMSFICKMQCKRERGFIKDMTCSVAFMPHPGSLAELISTTSERQQTSDGRTWRWDIVLDGVLAWGTENIQSSDGRSRLSVKVLEGPDGGTDWVIKFGHGPKQVST